MTWKEFKETVEKQGVLDTDQIGHIDITVWDSATKVKVFRDEYPGAATEVIIEEDWISAEPY